MAAQCKTTGTGRRVGRRYALAAVLAVAALLAAPVLGDASGGYSGTCGPTGGARLGDFSVACLTGVTQIADEAEFNNAELYSAYWPSDGHINESLWAFTGSPCAAGGGVEVGLTYGGYNDQAEYGFYYGWTVGGHYYGHFVSSQSENGSENVYALIWDGGGQYSIYIDGVIQYSPVGLSNGTCQGMVGLESTSAPSYSTSAATFNDTPLYWENPSGGWSSNFFSSYYVAYPCGLYGNTAPYCFNGAEYSSSYWANNQGT